MEDYILKIISTISYPGLLALAVYVSYKSGLLSAIATRLKGTAPEDRLKNLENFRFSAENNHFHDLENTINRQDRLEERFNKFELDFSQRLTRIETKMNGQLK